MIGHLISKVWGVDRKLCHFYVKKTGVKFNAVCIHTWKKHTFVGKLKKDDYGFERYIIMGDVKYALK